MSIGSVIKENKVFIAGLILPIILIMLFTIAKNIPLVDPPQYKIMFVQDGYGYGYGNFFYTIDENQHLKIDYKANKDNKEQYDKYDLNSTIFVYDPKTNALTNEEIKIPVSELSVDKLNIKTTKFNDIKLSSAPKSPDGYEYKGYDYNHTYFLSGIFSGHRDPSPYIYNSNNKVTIKSPRHSLYNAKFIGWVIEGDVK